MTLSQSSVLKLYKSVIEDTIASSREAFLDEEVDEQVLMELKQLWETKVTNSKAVQIDPPPEQTESAPSTSNSRKNQPAKREPVSIVNSNNTFTQNTQHNTAPGTSQQNVTNGTTVAVSGAGAALQQASAPAPQPQQQPQLQPQPQQQHPQPQQQQPQPPQPMFSNVIDPRKIVPIQITLPPQAGGADATGRVLTIQVPATALIGNQLQQVLTGPVISATMSLPQPQASNLLQQHVNAALQGQNSPLVAKAISQVDGVTHDDHIRIEFPDIFALYRALNSNNSRHIIERERKRKRSLKSQKISQIDGSDFAHGLLDDSSEDEDDVSDEPSEDEEIDEDKEDEDADIDEGGMEEEPLNSEDDVSEEDPTDLFDTENVVVCQYDKINRSRNKWKFYLKDGIMNLHGKDYVFQKITGDAEW